MINTLNETHLHKTLKKIYLLENEGSREEVDSSKEKDFKTDKSVSRSAYIFDIVTKEGNVIEIQTGNVSHLLAKIMYVTSLKKKITVVYPLVTTKYIETFEKKNTQLKKRKNVVKEILSYGTFEASSPNQNSSSEELILKSRRKSPSKKNIYSVLRELTGLTSVLLNKYFTLEILEISLTEERIISAEPVQSSNKRRRFRKNWVKSGKRLESINEKHIFHTKKDWLSLLPRNIPEQFTVTSLYESFKEENLKVTRQDISLLVWIYSRAGLFIQTGKQGNSYVYRKNK